MKNHKLSVLMFIVLLCAPAAANAFSVRHGEAVYVAEEEIVEGNLYAAGTNVTVDGHVTGDVFCAGQSVKVNGIVDGDVICAGQSVDVTGDVGGSVRVAASDVGLRGSVERGLTAFGANVDLEKEAVIGWDALIAGAGVRISGEIGRSLLGAGASFLLDGSIGEDAVLYLDNNKGYDKPSLIVADSAAIGRTLEYTSRTEASISGKAQIKGKVAHNLPPAGKAEERRAAGFTGIFLIAVLSAMAVGYVLAGVWKRPMTDITDAMLDKFWPTVGWGAVWMIVAPIIAILLAFTIIGFRLTLATVWSWLILLMISKVVVGIAMGRLLLKNAWEAKKDSLPWAAALGVILSWTVFYIPVIGWFLSLIAVWWGAGAILLYFKKSYDAGKTAAE